MKFNSMQGHYHIMLPANSNPSGSNLETTVFLCACAKDELEALSAAVICRTPCPKPGHNKRAVQFSQEQASRGSDPSPSKSDGETGGKTSPTRAESSACPQRTSSQAARRSGPRKVPSVDRVSSGAVSRISPQAPSRLSSQSLERLGSVEAFLSHSKELGNLQTHKEVNQTKPTGISSRFRRASSSSPDRRVSAHA